MTAVEFPEVNVRIAEDQPEYETLPARVGDVPIDEKFVATGATFCFKLSPAELEEVVRTGVIWQTQMTGGGKLQPIRMSTQKPDFL